MMLTELNVKLDTDTSEPKYSRMARLIEDYLETNQVPAGIRLPGERQLAEQFGVTCVTVNRSLNELVRRGILERKVGSGTYTADRSKHLCIAIVCHEEPSPSDYYTGSILSGFHKYWGGRADLLSIVKRPKDYEALIRNYNLSGMLVLSIQEEFSDTIAALRESHFPIVTIGVTLPQLGEISFGTDHQQICRQAVHYLVDHGCRRIGMLSTEYRKTAVQERERGYTKAMYDARLPVDPDWVIRKENPGDPFPEKQFRNLMRRKDRPDAFLIAAHYDLIPFYNLMHELNLGIPEDVSVIGFDDPDYARHLSPPLTVFRQPLEEISRQAAEQLESLILHHQAKTFPRCNAILMERGSCRCIR